MTARGHSVLCALGLTVALTSACPTRYAVYLSYELPASFTPEGFGDRAPSTVQAERWPPELQLVVSVYAPSDGVVRTCADYEHGRGTLENLAAATTFSGPLDEVNTDAVPRLGDKLIVLEGISSEFGPLVRGCAALGDIEGEVEVHIVLTPLAEVRTIERAHAVTPRDGPGTLDTVSVLTVDAFGRPAETAVEVMLYGPAGTLARPPEIVQTQVDPDALIEFDAKHELAYDDLDFVGPFALRLQAQQPLTDRLVVPGVAEPAESTFRPFDVTGDENPSRQLVPVRFGPLDLAYVRTAAIGRPEVAWATGVDDTGMPVLEDVAPPFAVSLGLVLIAELRSADGAEGVLLFRGNLGGRLAFWPQSGPPHEIDGGTQPLLADGTQSPYTLGDFEPGPFLALGPCAQHVLAGPYASWFTLSGTDDEDSGRFAIVSIADDGTPSLSLHNLPAYPLQSFCLDAPDGAVHRYVIVLTEQNGLAALSLGPAVLTDATNFANREFLNLPGVVAIGQTEIAAPARLLTATGSAFGIFLSEMRLDDDGVLLTENIPLYGLPLAPRSLHGGALYRAETRHDVHLLSTGNDGNEAARPLLFFAGATLDDGTPLSAAMDLDHCQPVQHCRVLLHDLDGDGVAEIYTGRINNRDGINRVSDPDLTVIRLRDTSYVPEDAPSDAE